MKFANRLSHKDILQLVPFYHVYDFEERQSLNPELRQFNMQPVYGSPGENVTIGDRYQTGTIRFYGVKEKDFLEFMVHKFGNEYVEWFKENELQITRKEIEEYSINRMGEYSRKVNICEQSLKN